MKSNSGQGQGYGQGVANGVNSTSHKKGKAMDLEIMNEHENFGNLAGGSTQRDTLSNTSSIFKQRFNSLGGNQNVLTTRHHQFEGSGNNKFVRGQNQNDNQDVASYYGGNGFFSQRRQTEADRQNYLQASSGEKKRNPHRELNLEEFANLLSQETEGVGLFQ